MKMVRKMVMIAAVFAVSAGIGGCFSLNVDEDIRMIDHYGEMAHDMRVLTNKMFFNFDRDNPFQ
jgi:hypothetical protein